MSYRKPLLAALFSTLLPFTTHAAFWAPHVGADYKYWNMKPSQDLTEFYKETFPRIDNAWSIYGGTRVNGYFGMDLGYDNAPVKRLTAVFRGGELIFAVPELNGNSTMIDIQLHALHFDLNFYWEVVHRLEVTFMLGVAYLHPESHISHFSVATGSWVEYTESERARYSGRFGFGLQYNVMPCLGLRASVNWDQVRRIEYQGFDENQNWFQVDPYHRATSFNVGFVYSWMWPRR